MRTAVLSLSFLSSTGLVNSQDAGSAQSNVVGRAQDVDLDNIDALGNELIGRGVDLAQDQLNSASRYDLVRVVSGTKQLVSGMKYKFNIEIAPTDCSRNTPRDDETICTPNTDQSVLFNVEGWLRPWLLHSDANNAWSINVKQL